MLRNLAVIPATTREDGAPGSIQRHRYVVDGLGVLEHVRSGKPDRQAVNPACWLPGPVLQTTAWVRLGAILVLPATQVHRTPAGSCQRIRHVFASPGGMINLPVRHPGQG